MDCVEYFLSTGRRLHRHPLRFVACLIHLANWIPVKLEHDRKHHIPFYEHIRNKEAEHKVQRLADWGRLWFAHFICIQNRSQYPEWMLSFMPAIIRQEASGKSITTARLSRKWGASILWNWIGRKQIMDWFSGWWAFSWCPFRWLFIN